MSNIKISVILPVFNSENYILESLTSLINQSYLPFEIIIINDFSTDSSENIILKFILDNNKRFRKKIIFKYFRNEFNSGPSFSRNIGLKNVSPDTDFICFLDADDYWLENKLRNQVSYICNDNSINFIFSHYYTNLPNIKCLNFFVDNSFYKKLLNFNCVSGSCSSVCISKSLVDEIGYFDENLWCGEDWDYWIRASQRTRFVCTLSTDVFIRIHSGSSQSNVKNMYTTLIRFYNKMLFKRNIVIFNFFKNIILKNLYDPEIDFIDKRIIRINPIIRFFFPLPSNRFRIFILKITINLVNFFLRFWRYLLRKLNV